MNRGRFHETLVCMTRAQLEAACVELGLGGDTKNAMRRDLWRAQADPVLARTVTKHVVDAINSNKRKRYLLKVQERREHDHVARVLFDEPDTDIDTPDLAAEAACVWNDSDSGDAESDSGDAGSDSGDGVDNDHGAGAVPMSC